MGLFGSSEKKEIVKKVRPTVVRTQNVAKELMNIAKTNNVNVNSLDFNLLDIQTYTRMNDSANSSMKDAAKMVEWERIPIEDLYEIDDETALLNKNFEIKQTYEIEVYSISKDTVPLCDGLKLAVGANATKCKVYLSIGAGSVVEYTPRLGQELETLINKKKIRAGILVKIFDEMLSDVISKIVAHVRVEETATYTKSEMILIAEGFEPTLTIDDALIMHYENNEEADDNTQVDYSSRDFIQSVTKDEVLIEYIKPKIGKAGRDCRGEFLQPSAPKTANEVSFSVDETIQAQETPESIKYIATENGYIAFDKNIYTIKTEVDVGQISFKTTGSIASGVDSDVSISVKETDSIKDAIGMGMLVEVTEIDIEGNVGSDAKVIAKRATIAGQTHGSAMVKADKLDINVHKGTAYGKEIKITRLEHGTVDGDFVEIAQALGGKIYAKEIEIEICASHVKATASRRIEINKMQGSENIFTINPILKKSAKAGFDENKGNIEEIENEVTRLKSEIKKYTKLLKDGTPAFLEIKKRLLHYKKNAVKMPASFVKKYKQFGLMQEHLKTLKEEHGVKADQLKLHTTRTLSFQDNILDARVINRDRWVGYNEIRFKLVKPAIELVYKPAEGSPDKIFGLVEVEEGEFEIQPVNS